MITYLLSKLEVNTFFFLPEIKAYVSFKQKSHDELLLALVPGKFWPL